MISLSNSLWILNHLLEFNMDSFPFREFTSFFSRYLYKNTIFHEFTIISLSVTLKHNDITISYANLLWILNQLLALTTLFHEYTMNSLSVARNNYLFSRIYYEFCISCSLYYLLSRIDFEFFIYFANQQCIYYMLSECTINSLPFSRIPF